MPGQGGVFNPINFAVYHYAGNNPLKYTDPTGLASIVDDNGASRPVTNPNKVVPPPVKDNSTNSSPLVTNNKANTGNSKNEPVANNTKNENTVNWNKVGLGVGLIGWGTLNIAGALAFTLFLPEVAAASGTAVFSGITEGSASIVWGIIVLSTGNSDAATSSIIGGIVTGKDKADSFNNLVGGTAPTFQGLQQGLKNKQ